MFSVCIPVFNEEENIQRIAENVMESDIWKSPEEKELIFCINGSNDKSAEIARRLAEHNPQVKVIELKPKGKNLAWEALVRQSNPHSEVLFFVDADVVLEPDTFSRLRSALHSERGLAIAGARMVPLQEKGILSIHRKTLQKMINRLKFEGREPALIGQCYAIKRKNAVRVEMPKDQRIAEDTFLDLFFDGKTRIIVSAKCFFRIPNYIDHIRQRARLKVSRELIIEQYPKLFEIFERKRRKAASIISRLRGELKWQELPGLGLNQLGELLAERKKSRFKRSKVDTWTKIRSTKRGLRK